MEGLKKVFPFWTSRIASDRKWAEVCLSRYPAAPNADHLLDVGVITVRGENEHLGVRDGLANLPGGLQPVEQRHRDVHDDHVGTELPGHFHGLAAGWPLRRPPRYRLSASSNFRRPSRTIMWSSASRTVMRFIDAPILIGQIRQRRSLCAPLPERNLRLDGRAFARRGFDAEAAADHLHPLSHAEQPQAFVSLRRATPAPLERICRRL